MSYLNIEKLKELEMKYNNCPIVLNTLSEMVQQVLMEPKEDMSGGLKSSYVLSTETLTQLGVISKT